MNFIKNIVYNTACMYAGNEYRVQSLLPLVKCLSVFFCCWSYCSKFSQLCNSNARTRVCARNAWRPVPRSAETVETAENALGDNQTTADDDGPGRLSKHHRVVVFIVACRCNQSTSL